MPYRLVGENPLLPCIRPLASSVSQSLDRSDPAGRKTKIIKTSMRLEAEQLDPCEWLDD